MERRADDAVCFGKGAVCASADGSIAWWAVSCCASMSLPCPREVEDQARQQGRQVLETAAVEASCGCNVPPLIFLLLSEHYLSAGQ